MEALTFAAADGERIPAVFCRPPPGAPPAPAVIYAHAHGRRYEMGCDELMRGRPALRSPYGPALRRTGIAALSLDMLCFGGRRSPGEEARAKAALWRGETLFGQMIAELSGAAGFLTRCPAIDPERIGVIGFSMGGTHAFWLAALDARIRCAASLCAFADIAALIDGGAHDLHGSYMTVPGLLPSWSTGRVAAQAAPRPLFLGVGLEDPLTPKDPFETALRDVQSGYAAAGALDALSVHIERKGGHQETPEMRAAALAFLGETLQ